jgi:hypothetical protein
MIRQQLFAKNKNQRRCRKKKWDERFCTEVMLTVEFPNTTDASTFSTYLNAHTPPEESSAVVTATIAMNE